ncbi:MAG: hypothetical protein DRI61_07180 [Chloroflexi bacterium]|nr:MAG: hypothetical protein DRI61_07180 [Chloroflexota bacterium]
MKGKEQEARSKKLLQSLEEAVELYRGDFLEGFYDDWCLEERYRLEGLYLETLERLVAAYEALNQPEKVLHYARLLLERDPFREDIHRKLIRLYVQLGNRAEAIRQARWCRTLFQAELGTEPSPETIALCDQLLGAAWRYAAYEEIFPQRSPPPRGQPALILEHPPFVGREAVWKKLLSYWEKAKSGQGHLVLISGEAGVGKSRLVGEFSHHIRRRGGWAACGYCYEYEQALPYSPLTELLREILSFTGKRTLQSLASWQLAELSRLVPELSEQFQLPSLQHLPLEQEQARLFEALTSFLLDLARHNPLLLVLEDIHWAHDSTLAWIHHLTRHLPRVPALVLATYRREEVNPEHPLYGLAFQVEQAGLATRLELTRLPREALTQWMVGASDSLVDRIYRQTEGNPFFTLELLRTLFEEGYMQLSRGRWVEKATPAQFPVPASVCQVVQRRLGRLSPSARKAAAVASVIGRAFDFDVLDCAWGQGEEATLEALDELLRRHLIHEGSGPTGRDYEFEHHLVREVIYQGLHHRRRRRLHRLVGEALEKLYPDPSEIAGELAYHFERAGEPLRALPYLLQAGHNAAALYAYEEAIDYWERAFSIFTSLPEAEAARFRDSIGAALLARAELFHLQGRPQERQADLRRLQKLAERTDDTRLLDQVLIREARYLNLDGRYDQALKKAQEAAARCRERGDADGEAQALAEWGFAHYFRGEYEAALKPLKAALQLEQLDPSTKGAVLSVLSYAHYLIADYQRSLEYRQQALEIRSALGQQARVAEDLTDMGILYTRLHQLSLAEQYLKEALRLAREIGSQPAESYALNNLGNLHYLRGNYAEALKYYADSLVLQRATGSRRGEASALGNSGMTLLAMGDYEKAETLLRQSLAIEEEIGYESGLSEGLAQLALVLMNRDQSEEALEAATRALKIAQRIGDRYCQVMALNTLARLYTTWGRPSKAIAFAEEAIALAQEIGLNDGCILGLALLGEAHLALGEPQAALECTAQAVALLEEHRCFEGPEEEIYFAHYQALKALEREREALAALQKAYAEVMRKAESLSDEQRHRFLEKVPLNRQIVAAYEAS